MSKLDRFIVNVIKERILTPENIAKLIAMINKEIRALRDEFQSSFSQLKKLIDDEKINPSVQEHAEWGIQQLS